MAAVAHLEAALVEHLYSSPAAAAHHVQAAGGAIGLEVELTGALGVRTRHQQDAKAQLVIQTGRGAEAAASGEESGDECEWLDALAGEAAPESEDVLPTPQILGGEWRVGSACPSSPSIGHFASQEASPTVLSAR